MEKGKSPSDEMSRIVTQSVEQARGAMENYLGFLQKSMSAMPWAPTDMNKKLISNAEKNVASAFDYAQKLTGAKDPQEFMQIQAEFVQKQIAALTDQAKDLGDTAMKDATNALKGATKPSP